MTMRGLSALVFVTMIGMGCAVESEDESTEVQSLGAGCTLLRPILWDSNGVQCLESPNTPLPMADGDYYTAFSGGGGFYGHGSVTLRCSNGWLEELSRSCRPGIEP